MRIATLLSYAGGFKEAVAEVKALEKAGLDVVWVPEAYSFDAPSAMGYIAAETERVTIASGILPIYTRTPSLLAMTAAGIDYLDFRHFASEKRIDVDLNTLNFKILNKLFAVGDEYVEELAKLKEKDKLRRKSSNAEAGRPKRRKSDALRERDPW